MERILKFDIEKAELIKTVSDEEFAIMRVFVCHDGNNTHNLPISLDTIKLSAENSLRGKPILYEYVPSTGDMGSHSPSQIPGGYFRENQTFEYVEQDEKTFLVAEAVFWKIYGSKAYELFVQENYRPVSMEIRVLETELNEENNLEEITNMSFMGVTILGLDIPEACKGSNTQIIKFTEAVKEAEKALQFSSSENEENLNINSNEKEDEQMSFNKQEFAMTFSMTANDMREMMQDAVSEIKYGEHEWSKYWMSDYDASYMYCYDEEEGGKVAIPYSMEDGNCKPDFENAKPCKTMTQWVILEEKEEFEEHDPMMEMAKAMMAKEEKKKEIEQMADNANNEALAQAALNAKESEDNKKLTDEEKMAAEESQKEEEKEKEEFATKIADLEEKFATLSEENKTLKSDNEQLKTFKSEIEEKEKLVKIEFTLREVLEAGMPKEKVEEFREKAVEFSMENIQGWVNEVKANALDFAKEKTTKEDGFIKIGTTWAVNGTEKKRGLWDK